MVRTAAALAAIWLVGCVHADVAALIASEATLACDWGQTRSAAALGWRGHEETNILLGHQPSTTHVDVYFGVAAVLDAALWIMLPDTWRGASVTGVTAIEADSIVHNIPTTDSICGLGRHGRS